MMMCLMNHHNLKHKSKKKKKSNHNKIVQIKNMKFKISSS